MHLGFRLALAVCFFKGGPMGPNEYPPRFILSGVVLNVFLKPAGKSKDGQSYGGDWCVQVMSADHLKNAETKLTPTDFSVGADKAEADRYKALMGKLVKVPVSVYVSQGQMRVNLASEKAAAA
jgi:hypothetical protein